jgi:hypothetical protein
MLDLISPRQRIDPKGNLKQESIFTNSPNQSSFLDSYYDYDQYGNMIHKKDANGNETWYDYSTNYSSTYLTRVYNNAIYKLCLLFRFRITQFHY